MVTVLAMAVVTNRLPSKALTVQSHWIEEILSGRKVWELRNQSRRLRGEVAVVANGQLLGQVNFDDAFLVSERDSGHAVIAPPGNEQNFLALAGNMAKHGVQDLGSTAYTRVWAWVMSSPARYSLPVPYRHLTGQLPRNQKTSALKNAKGSRGSHFLVLKGSAKVVLIFLGGSASPAHERLGVQSSWHQLGKTNF